jgi:hypothetical protein
MLRITHCLDNRLTDGGKVVSPTHEQTPGPGAGEGLDKLKNSPHYIIAINLQRSM